ncbi:hypothetical protein VPHF86_0256 [Vibrio phage F86]
MISAYIVSAWIVLTEPKLKRIFCIFNWHTWDYKKGGHRECRHCGKGQSSYKVGGDSGWH